MMTPADDYNARLTAANLHMQDRSRTPEEWFAYLTAGQPDAAVLAVADARADHPSNGTPPYDQDTEEEGPA